MAAKEGRMRQQKGILLAINYKLKLNFAMLLNYNLSMLCNLFFFRSLFFESHGVLRKGMGAATPPASSGGSRVSTPGPRGSVAAAMVMPPQPKVRPPPGQWVQTCFWLPNYPGAMPTAPPPPEFFGVRLPPKKSGRSSSEDFASFFFSAKF